MKTKGIVIAGILMCIGVATGTAQGNAPAFRPAVFWREGSNKGAIIVGPREVLILDANGNKKGIVATNDDVSSAYPSPDGKKLLYTSETGIWLANVETGVRHLVAAGFCDYLRWNSDGSSFMFATYEKVDGPAGSAYKINLFWADGNGKNIKQVYP